MSPTTLARLLQSLPERPPITTEFECLLQIRRRWSRTGVWYGSQKEHWRGWLRGYRGPGFYKRKKWDRPAEFAYTHLLCPPMVLWLGEASGVPKRKVKLAMRAALSASSSLPAQCAAIRKVIPWELVETSIKRRGTKHSGRGKSASRDHR